MIRDEAFTPVRPEMKGEKLICNGTSKIFVGKKCFVAIAHYQNLNPFSSLGCNVGIVLGLGGNKIWEFFKS